MIAERGDRHGGPRNRIAREAQRTASDVDVNVPPSDRRDDDCAWSPARGWRNACPARGNRFRAGGRRFDRSAIWLRFERGCSGVGRARFRRGGRGFRVADRVCRIERTEFRIGGPGCRASRPIDLSAEQAVVLSELVWREGTARCESRTQCSIEETSGHAQETARTREQTAAHGRRNAWRWCRKCECSLLNNPLDSRKTRAD